MTRAKTNAPSKSIKYKKCKRYVTLTGNKFPPALVFGVCMYYKDFLPIIRRDYLCTLQESLVVEMKSGSQSCFLLDFIDLQVKTKTNWNSFVVTLTYVFPVLMI